MNTTGLRNKNLEREVQNLVYRVSPMPESMFYFVWNYDKLDENDELFYIQKIIESEGQFTEREVSHLLVEVVFLSQKFVRENSPQWSCSLRDVKRFSKLCLWFYEVYYAKKFDSYKKKEDRYCMKEAKLRSIVLALAFTYHNRLQSSELKDIYRKYFKSLYDLNLSEHQLTNDKIKTDKDFFLTILLEEENFLLDRLILPPDIGRNQAILDNIFTLFVSIYNRIPLIITGPPGSSKSLSYMILQQSLKGEEAKDSFLKSFPAVKSFFYQGNTQSTSQSIEKIFNDAIGKQVLYLEQKLNVQVVVLLDEIGLAEISPHNPLKILHSILEHP